MGGPRHLLFSLLIHSGHPLGETPTFDQGLLRLAFPLTDNDYLPKIALACLPADGSQLLAHALVTELKVIVLELSA
jgi:hypothetical protein